MGVGDLLGKLFGADSGKSDTPLRAYGKLPMYAEYRRLEVSPGTPTAYSQWLDAGRLAWVNSPTKTPQGVTRPARLLLRLPDAREWIVASVWDSRDTVGRVFPFSFFVACPPEALGDSAVERFIAATALFAAFDRAHGELPQLAAGGDFYRYYGKRRIPLRAEDHADRLSRARTDAAAIDAQAWLRQISPDGKVDPGLLFGALKRRAVRWQTQSDAVDGLAISCPLVPDASIAAQVVMWLEWLGPLLARRTPWIVLPADGARPGAAAHLLLRNPMPDDFQLLTTDDAVYGFIERIGYVPTDPTGSSIVSVAEPPAGSLLHWLRENGPKPA